MSQSKPKAQNSLKVFKAQKTRVESLMKQYAIVNAQIHSGMTRLYGVGVVSSFFQK
jgi:hypothetical protein